MIMLLSQASPMVCNQSIEDFMHIAPLLQSLHKSLFTVHQWPGIDHSKNDGAMSILP